MESIQIQRPFVVATCDKEQYFKSRNARLQRGSVAVTVKGQVQAPRYPAEQAFEMDFSNPNMHKAATITSHILNSGPGFSALQTLSHHRPCTQNVTIYQRPYQIAVTSPNVARTLSAPGCTNAGRVLQTECASSLIFNVSKRLTSIYQSAPPTYLDFPPS